jgi:hypothetical protein
MGLRAAFPGGFYHDRVHYFAPSDDGSGVLSAEPLPRKPAPPTRKESDPVKPSASAAIEGIIEGGAGVEADGLVLMPEADSDAAAEEKSLPEGVKPNDNPQPNELLAAIAKCRETDRLTCLAVDYSGRCGAPVLVVMTGRGLRGSGVVDVEGVGGARAVTTGVLAADDRPYHVMTIQKGPAPRVTAPGNRIMVGDLTIRFDGEKLVLE